MKTLAVFIPILLTSTLSHAQPSESTPSAGVVGPTQEPAVALRPLDSKAYKKSKRNSVLLTTGGVVTVSAGVASVVGGVLIWRAVSRPKKNPSDPDDIFYDINEGIDETSKVVGRALGATAVVLGLSLSAAGTGLLLAGRAERKRARGLQNISVAPIDGGAMAGFGGSF